MTLPAGSSQSPAPAASPEPLSVSSAGLAPGSFSAEDYRRLLDAIPASIFTLNAAGLVEYANSYFTAYSGLPARVLTTNQVFAVIHPDDHARLRDEAPRQISQGMPYSGHYRLLRSDGVYRQHLVRLTPSRDEAGALIGWVGSCTDIEDQALAQRAQRFLADAAEVLASSLDQARTLSNLARVAVPYLGVGCAIDMHTAEGAIATVAVAHVHPEIEEVIWRMRRRFPPAPEGPHPVARVIRSGQPELAAIDMEFLRQVTQDPDHLADAMQLNAAVGLTVPLSARGEALGALTFYRGPGGTYDEAEVNVASALGRIAGLAIDNARLFGDVEQTADRLRHANRVKDEFLGMVSHELRTPLTTIMGNADILYRRSGALSPELLAHAVKDIKTHSDRLQQIIENMLVLARVETLTEWQPEPVLLQRFLRRQSGLFMAANPDREVRIDVMAGLGPVRAQPTYLGQVIDNLLGNANKYSPAGTPITLRARPLPNGMAQISVLDRGFGIGAGEAERIFAPFYRAEKDEARAAGAGLGLAVCRRLVELQGGQITARARRGGGTEVLFTLPMEWQQDDPDDA